jgi:hypothetical protein
MTLQIAFWRFIKQPREMTGTVNLDGWFGKGVVW